MIGNMYFSKTSLKNLTEFIGVGMYDYEGSYNHLYRHKKGLLLSLGTSSDAINYFDEIKLKSFLHDIKSMQKNSSWHKSQLVDLFNEMIPNFSYVDKNKYLDEKM